MKKIITIVICFMLICHTTGCTYFNNNTTSNTKETTFYTTKGQLQQGNSGGIGVGGAAYYKYITFEELCSDERMTTVVSAKLKSSQELTKNIRYIFEVQETFRGNASGEISVIVDNAYPGVVGFDDGMLRFNNGYPDFSEDENTEYLLVLASNALTNSYNKIESYYWIHGTIINLDDLNQSNMYNDFLGNHMEGLDLKNSTREEVISYVLELVKDNPSEKVPSKATTLVEIINDSNSVVHIKPTLLEFQTRGDIFDLDIWYCEVIDILKDVDDNITENMVEGKIIACFMPDSIQEGEEYIVAFDKNDDAYFTLTTKDSLRPVSEKAEIKGYIN